MARKSPVPYLYKLENALLRRHKPLFWEEEDEEAGQERRDLLARLDSLAYTVEEYIVNGWRPNARLYEQCKEMGFIQRMDLKVLHEDILDAQAPLMRRLL